MYCYLQKRKACIAELPAVLVYPAIQGFQLLPLHLATLVLLLHQQDPADLVHPTKKTKLVKTSQYSRQEAKKNKKDQKDLL